MIDFDAVLYDPIYGVLGVEATLTPKATGIAVIGLTVIDMTAGVAIDSSHGLSLQTLKPAAAVRLADLADHDLARADLKNASISFNDADWEIEATAPKPPGELYLLLSEKPA